MFSDCARERGVTWRLLGVSGFVFATLGAGCATCAMSGAANYCETCTKSTSCLFGSGKSGTCVAAAATCGAGNGYCVDEV